MNISNQIEKHFDELLALGQKVLDSRHKISSGSGVRVVVSPDLVDPALSEEWATSCLSFLGRVLGKDSEHYQRFSEHSKGMGYFSHASKGQAVLKAAKADYSGGFLFDARRRIQAEVFDEFLEQADYFLAEGYFQVAAVVAGAVLEDSLRKVCVTGGIVLPERPKLDWMNSELAKLGTYDKLVQKKVTWMADIRHKAAHGKWTEFNTDDSAELIKGVRRFVTEYVGS